MLKKVIHTSSDACRSGPEETSVNTQAARYAEHMHRLHIGGVCLLWPNINSTPTILQALFTSHVALLYFCRNHMQTNMIYPYGIHSMCSFRVRANALRS